MLTLIILVAISQCPPPAVTLTIAPNAGSMDANGNRLPRVSWSVQCPPQSAVCPNVPTASLSLLRTEFAASPAETLGQGTGFQGPTGEGPLPGMSSSVVGANVQFSALAECNNAGSSGRFRSAPVVFAPTLSPNSRFVAERDAAGAVVGVQNADAIPVDVPVQLRGGFEVVLAPNEVATVRVSGAGVDFSKAYSFPDRRSATAVMQAYIADPSAQVRFASPGPVRMWVELAGVKSVEAAFTVLAANGAGGGSGGGAGAAGGGGGGPTQGCSSSGAPLVGALAMLWLRRRARAVPRA